MSAAPSRPLDPTAGYAPALDGLRAVAALAVIALHTGIYSGQVASSWLGVGTGGPLGPVLSRMTVGVPVFFVLSGLLLYRPWVEAALDDRRGPSPLVYLWHRALRILPAYWIVAVVALAAFGTTAATTLGPVLRTLTLTHVYVPAGPPLGITQTWSLAVEVSFYVLLPVFALGLARVVRLPRGAWLAFLGFEAIALIALGWTHRAAAGPYPPAHLWLPEYLGYFGAGIGLAVASARLARRRAPTRLAAVVARAPWAPWLVALAAYVVMATPVTGTTARYPTLAEATAEQLLSLVVAVGLVLPLALAPGRGPSRLLGRRVPRALGRVSYGLFLWHMVIVEGWLRLTGGTAGTQDWLVLFPVAVLGSVVCATLSFAAVERPARRLRPLAARWLGRRPEPVPPAEAPVVVEVRT